MDVSHSVLTSFIFDIFSKTKQYFFLLLDKLLPDSVMASSRSEENVDKLLPDSVMASSRSEENVVLTFSSDLEEAMTESGESLSNSKKYCSVLEKISKING